jgi:hypothetical protein
LPRLVQAPIGDQFSGSIVESCSPSCGGCSCTVTDNIDYFGYCVNADEDLARFDCPVSGVPCTQLSDWRWWVESHQDIADDIGGGGTVDELQRCLDRIDDELDNRCGARPCLELRAIPVETDDWCYSSAEVVVVDCLPGPDHSCTDDGYCVRRLEDGAVFVGLGSSCFNQLRDRWVRCTAEENEELTSCAMGRAGAGGEGGAAAAAAQ